MIHRDRAGQFYSRRVIVITVLSLNMNLVRTCLTLGDRGVPLRVSWPVFMLPVMTFLAGSAYHFGSGGTPMPGAGLNTADFGSKDPVWGGVP